ncbi:PAS domain-containing sensor histidine kinase [Halolamina pelagica]|uniref:PAS domain-containing sensor histidine kinase n=1 Tax=Halolamina pelagica TaxID=699431 RepID=UPI0023BA5F9C|nr:PAS domain-containing sensor histidine kinase [Halolamina pelagica]
MEEEREFVEKALDTIDDVFYVIDCGGNLERWNKALVEISGYTRDEVLASDVEDFFVDRHGDRISESISRAFVNGSDTTEAVVETKSGEQIPYEFRKKRLMKGDSVIGVVGIGRDITQQRSREQHLKAVDYLLQHNLRNHLNVIRGNADELVGREKESDKRRIETIHRSVDKLLSLFDRHQQIVSQVLEENSREQIDIVAVLEGLFEEFRELYPRAVFSLSAPKTAQVLASPSIERSLRELIVNAVKHNSSETPEVTAVVEAESTPVTITLRDNGPQISKDEYEFIENPEALSSTSHPTGLGLWAANLAVTYSRGTFTIREAPKDGNEIPIELPVTADDWEDRK